MSNHEVKATALERTPSGALDVATHGAGARAMESPLRKAHRLLRGRYPLAVILALLGVVGGAYLGWKSQKPIYKSHGVIYVSPNVKTTKTPDGGSALPMLSGFIALQVELLQSPRTTKMAMEEEVWAPYSEGLTAASIQRFEERREIRSKGRAQHVLVEFYDPDPKVAQAGVMALMDAYGALLKETYLREDRARLVEAQARIKSISNEIHAMRETILDDTEAYGGKEALQERHMAMIRRVFAAENGLDGIDAEIRRAQDEAVPDDEQTAAPLTPEEIAVSSPSMANDLLQIELLRAREALMAEKRREKSEILIQLRTEIRVRQERINSQAEATNRLREQRRPRAANRVTVEELEARKQQLEAHRNGLDQDSQRIGRVRDKVARLEARILLLEQEKRENESLVSYLAAELNEEGSGRVTIKERGFLPRVPYKDGRLSRAAAGGLFGGALGLFLVMLLGLTNRKLKSSTDIDDHLGGMRLLGLLPILPEDISDPAGAEVAVHCVHHIRTLLQIGCACDRGASICVTGPSAGSGKTTLTAALSLSFTSSGSRTLLVDCDLIGQGLTEFVARLLSSAVLLKAGEPEVIRQVRVEADPGEDPSGQASRRMLEPLVHRGARWTPPRPGELRELLSRMMKAKGLRELRDTRFLQDLFALSDVLHRGKGRDELEALLIAELASAGQFASESPGRWIPAPISELGVGQAGFNGTGYAPYIFPTGVEGLHFLPLRGLGRGGDVSVSTIATILDRIKGEFDTILIDTGPVPGTLETPMVAKHSDAVVMVVSQGDARAGAEKAIQHIQEVGGRVSGIVFNRAGRRDVFQASRSMSRAASRDRALQP